MTSTSPRTRPEPQAAEARVARLMRDPRAVHDFARTIEQLYRQALTTPQGDPHAPR